MTLIYCAAAAAVVSSDLNTLAKSQILKYTDKVSSFGENTNKDCFSRKMYQHFQKRKSLRIIFVEIHNFFVMGHSRSLFCLFLIYFKQT